MTARRLRASPLTLAGMALLLPVLAPMAVAVPKHAPAVKPAPAAAAPAAAAPAKAPAAPFLPGAGSKQPVSIDADKLDYYDKEQKLIYTGNVVAVQGDSTLKASVLTIFLQKDPQPGPAPADGSAAPAPGTPSVGPASGSSVRHMEADGPVTLISKDQIGTGDHASYDKGENKVYMTGNVTLSQGTNVTQGDRLVYDLTTGQAQVFSGGTAARVKSLFTPGSGTPGPQGTPPPAKKETPRRKGGAPLVAAPADAATQP